MKAGSSVRVKSTGGCLRHDHSLVGKIGTVLDDEPDLPELDDMVRVRFEGVIPNHWWMDPALLEEV